MDRRDRINNRCRFLSHPVHPVDPCSSVPRKHRRHMTKPWGIRDIRGRFILVAAGWPGLTGTARRVVGKARNERHVRAIAIALTLRPPRQPALGPGMSTKRILSQAAVFRFRTTIVRSSTCGPSQRKLAAALSSASTISRAVRSRFLLTTAKTRSSPNC